MSAIHLPRSHIASPYSRHPKVHIKQIQSISAIATQVAAASVHIKILKIANVRIFCCIFWFGFGRRKFATCMNYEITHTKRNKNCLMLVLHHHNVLMLLFVQMIWMLNGFVCSSFFIAWSEIFHQLMDLEFILYGFFPMRRFWFLLKTMEFCAKIHLLSGA